MSSYNNSKNNSQENDDKQAVICGIQLPGLPVPNKVPNATMEIITKVTIIENGAKDEDIKEIEQIRNDEWERLNAMFDNN